MTIEAWRWNGTDEVLKTDPDWVAECTEPTTSPFALSVITGGLIVHTARGKQRLKPGDYIVRVGEEILLVPGKAWESMRATVNRTEPCRCEVEAEERGRRFNERARRDEIARRGY